MENDHGRRLRHFRKQKGLTQRQFGAAVGLSQSTVSQMETGARGALFLQIQGEIVAALDITVAEFWGDLRSDAA